MAALHEFPALTPDRAGPVRRADSVGRTCHEMPMSPLSPADRDALAYLPDAIRQRTLAGIRDADRHVEAGLRTRDREVRDPAEMAEAGRDRDLGHAGIESDRAPIRCSACQPAAEPVP